MREIKFRAWDKEKKIMFKVGDDYGTTHPCDPLIYWKQGQEVILLQYTGLKDKNSKEIYEGDILKLGNTSSFIIWSLDQWIFNSYMERGNLNLYSYTDKTTGKEIAEIIGNIYENPELLKDR